MDKKFPCSICLVSCICKKICDIPEQDTIKILITIMENGCCPDCGYGIINHSTKFNFFYCTNCMHAFCGRIKNKDTFKFLNWLDNYLILDTADLILNYFDGQYTFLHPDFEIRRKLINELEDTGSFINIHYKK